VTLLRLLERRLGSDGIVVSGANWLHISSRIRSTSSLRNRRKPEPGRRIAASSPRRSMLRTVFSCTPSRAAASRTFMNSGFDISIASSWQSAAALSGHDGH
jgi:hypothetical protein